MVEQAGSVEVEVRANLDPYRRSLKQAEAEAKAFERTASNVDKPLAAAARRAGISVEAMAQRVANARANVEGFRQSTTTAAGSTTQFTAAQQRAIQSLNAKIVATQLSGRELAVHTALTRANTAANTVAGQQIARLAVQHHELAKAQQVSTGTGSAFMSRAMGPLIGAFVGGQAVMAVRRMISETARIDEVARRFGMTTTEVQGFRHEVALATGSVTNADMALDMFAKQAGQAAEGTGYLSKLFAANNVELRDQNGNLRSNTELWNEFIRLIATARTEQERMRMAMGVLGEEGRNVVEVLKRGPEELSEAYRQAERDGKFLSQQAINDAKQINKEWTNIEKTISVGVKGAIIAMINEVRNLPAAMEEARQRGFSMSSQWGRAPTQLTERPRAGIGLDDMVEHEAGAFLGMPSRLPPPKPKRDRLDEYERATRAVERNIVALQAEMQTIGRSDAAIEAHTVKMELERAAIEAKIPLTDALRANIDKLAGSYGVLVESLSKARLQEDLMFERGQMGRSPMDQAIADRLRGAGLPIDFNSVEAGMIRVNEQMRLGIDLSTEFASGFARDMRNGKSEAEAFGNALGRLGDKLLDMALQTGANALFGGFGSLFGGGGSNFSPMTSAGAIYHDGGIAGITAAPMRRIHSAYFENAPRYHNGGVAGLAPDEVPAILQRGERVIPNGGGGMNVSFSVGSGSQDTMRTIRAYVNSPAFEADWIRQSRKAHNSLHKLDR